MIVYDKLWKFLETKDMQKTDLLNVVSSPTLAKLGKNENVNVSVIATLCTFLQCQPSDIIENIETEEEKEKREKYNALVNQMCESLYKLIQSSCDKSGKTLNEQWNEYLEKMSPKRRNSPNFRVIKQYIDNRIKNLE